MVATSDTGINAFVAGLRRCGVESNTVNGVVTFAVDVVDGTYAGQRVETGVGADELVGWPLVPPHWVHLPGTVNFVRTNSEGSAVPGWRRHSRNIVGWGSAHEPAQGWIAHVRSVLADAS